MEMEFILQSAMTHFIQYDIRAEAKLLLRFLNSPKDFLNHIVSNPSQLDIDVHLPNLDTFNEIYERKYYCHNIFLSYTKS